MQRFVSPSLPNPEAERLLLQENSLLSPPSHSSFSLLCFSTITFLMLDVRGSNYRGVKSYRNMRSASFFFLTFRCQQVIRRIFFSKAKINTDSRIENNFQIFNLKKQLFLGDVYRARGRRYVLHPLRIAPSCILPTAFPGLISVAWMTWISSICLRSPR